MGGARLAGKPVEVVGLSGDGREFPIELTLSSWIGPAGREYGAVIRDISERRARQVRLEHLAHHDASTGLLNRHGFERRVRETLAQTGVGTMIRIDLAGLALLNDTVDHGTSEAVVQTAAIRVRSAADRSDLVARVADDGFALWLPRSCPDAAQVTARRVVEAFETRIVAGGLNIPMPVAVGIAEAPRHASDTDELLTCAELAMRRAKTVPSGTCLTFEPTMSNEAIARRAFRDEILRATTGRQWELHYQPQVDLSNGQRQGAEALLRWKHPRRGLLSPAAYLGELETHACAHDVGLWILDEACRQLAAWRRAGSSIDQVAVNLFSVQLHSASLVTDVLAALRRHCLEPGHLELEIPETVAIASSDRAIDRLRELRACGVGIALDDFGTGFAALQTLKQFPVSRLKIDRSFVQNVETDTMSNAIIDAILRIGRRLGIQVVAEGIEHPSQSDILRKLGCEVGQGYLYGRPVPPDL